MTRIVSFWLLVAIIVAVSLGFYRVMSGFLLPLFLAALLVVIFKPLHEWLLVRLRHAMLAAGIATTAVVLIVFVPLIWSLTLAANEAISVARQFDANRVTRQIQRLQILLRLDLPLVEETLELTPLLDDLLLEPVAVSPSGASEQETVEKTTSEKKTVEKATSDIATAEKESPERNSPDRQSSDDPDTAGNVPGGRTGPGDASESPSTTAPATTAPSTAVPSTRSSA
ncbi:MAG: hypothetical protein ACKPEY_02230, partial [Planctomycetota bacterium]